MKLYLAGPMTGLPDYNYPAFNAAAEALRAAGHEVENPAENPAPVSGEWLDYMRMSIQQIARVDAIAVLPEWNLSRGARVEVGLAEGLGLTVGTVGAFL